MNREPSGSKIFEGKKTFGSFKGENFGNVTSVTPVDDISIDLAEPSSDDEKKAGRLKRRSDLCPPSVGLYNSEIREGEEYQCNEESLRMQPSYSECSTGESECNREICVWMPYNQIDEEKLLPYLSLALMCGIEQDRAMYILMKAGYNFAVAKENLMQRQILKKAWCDYDVRAFERCCRIFGKRFHKFRYLLPNKTYGEIIEFYYNNKKLMKFRNWFIEAFDESDSDDEKTSAASCQNIDAIGDCDNCGIEKVSLRTICEMDLCSDCHLHFSTFKTQRPCVKSFTKIRINSKAQLSLDMEEKMKDFGDFAALDREEYETLKTQSGDDDDIQIVVEKKRVAERKLSDAKKRISALRSKCLRMEHDIRLFYKQNLSDGIDQYRLSTEVHENRRPRTVRNWDYKEKFFAFYAFERYGKDFDAIAALIGTKNASDVKNFYGKFSKEIDKAYKSRQSMLQKRVDAYDFTTLMKTDKSDVEVVDLE